MELYRFKYIYIRKDAEKYWCKYLYEEVRETTQWNLYITEIRILWNRWQMHNRENEQNQKLDSLKRL